jgi:hypothetical protein
MKVVKIKGKDDEKTERERERKKERAVPIFFEGFSTNKD